MDKSRQKTTSAVMFMATLIIQVVVSNAYDACLDPKEEVMIESIKTCIQQLSSQISGLEASLTGTLIGCDNGWTQYRNHCYFFSSDMRNWFEAERYCREHSSWLANIEDAAENKWILTKSPTTTDNYGFWLGGSDMKEGQWLWNIDFKPFSYVNWRTESGEPNGGSLENCLHTFDSKYEAKWNDLSCERTVRFVCKRKLKLNPSIEAPVTRILDQIRNCLESEDKGTNISVDIKEDEEGNSQKLLLKINSQLAGMPFIWHFICHAAEKELASENLIIPLMAMVGELTRRQKELIKLLKSKDKEIDDYKSQGAKTSRKHIETQEFVETAFENSMLMSKGFEEEVKNLGDTAFNEEGQDLYRQIMTKNAWIHRQKNGTETESSSIDEDEPTEISGSDQGKRPSTGTSWGTSRLPPSVTGPKSESPSQKSPKKSPASSKSNTPDTSPLKDSELLRRQALERRLESEEAKKQEKNKKKKKMAF